MLKINMSKSKYIYTIFKTYLATKCIYHFFAASIGQCQVLLDGRHGTAGRVHAGNAAAE